MAPDRTQIGREENEAPRFDTIDSDTSDSHKASHRQTTDKAMSEPDTDFDLTDIEER
jgi:hypothetical protein